MNDIESLYDDMRKDVCKHFADADRDSLHLMFQLAHTFNKAHAHMSSVVHPSQLTLSGFNVLSILSHQGTKGMPLSDLSKLLLVSRANVTGLIDSLEKKGLVKRADHASDRRVYLACITKKGDLLLNKYRPNHFRAIKSIASVLNSDEKKLLNSLLAKFRSGIASTKEAVEI